MILKFFWACPCGSGYPFQVLVQRKPQRLLSHLPTETFEAFLRYCGLSTTIPHAKKQLEIENYQIGNHFISLSQKHTASCPPMDLH